jgi:predicted nicotinamide N-methyase
MRIVVVVFAVVSLFVCASVSAIVSAAEEAPAIFESAMAAPGPVLLLKGTRWAPSPGDEANLSFYGQPLRVAQRPASSTSWAAVETGDKGGGEDAAHEEKTGLTIWDGAVALARYLEHRSVGNDNDQAVSVVELGAGCGFVGLSLLVGGARSVVLTDVALHVPLLRQNLEDNSAGDVVSGGRAAELDWTWANSSQQQLLESFVADYGRGIDLVLASDCLWVEWLVDPFVRTLERLTETDASPAAEILIAYEERARRTEEKFFQRMKASFSVAEVPLAAQHPDFRDRYIHIYSCRRLQGDVSNSGT